mmetsp:Transcript_34735/g.85480  ORF Transcript_34735/g.85480 Transcript_34735/m.85480 type:complete len:423 (+) Transcript_34735:90-1358(+)
MVMPMSCTKSASTLCVSNSSFSRSRTRVTFALFCGPTRLESPCTCVRSSSATSRSASHSAHVPPHRVAAERCLSCHRSRSSSSFSSDARRRRSSSSIGPRIAKNTCSLFCSRRSSASCRPHRSFSFLYSASTSRSRFTSASVSARFSFSVVCSVSISLSRRSSTSASARPTSRSHTSHACGRICGRDGESGSCRGAVRPPSKGESPGGRGRGRAVDALLGSSPKLAVGEIPCRRRRTPSSLARFVKMARTSSVCAGSAERGLHATLSRVIVCVGARMSAREHRWLLARSRILRAGRPARSTDTMWLSAARTSIRPTRVSRWSRRCRRLLVRESRVSDVSCARCSPTSLISLSARLSTGSVGMLLRTPATSSLEISWIGMVQPTTIRPTPKFRSQCEQEAPREGGAGGKGEEGCASLSCLPFV